MVISPVDVTLVPVNLVNPEDVTSMQFDIHLPAGLALAKNEYEAYSISKTSRLDGSFVLSSSDVDGAVRVLIYSSQNHSIQGNEGAIVELPVVLVDQSATEGDTFEVLIDNISVTMAEVFTEKFMAESTATLTVGKRYTLGDVNNDGRYSAADVSMVVSYVLGGNPNGGVREAADVNEDGRISAADVSILVSYILSNRQVNAPRRVNQGSVGLFAEQSDFVDYRPADDNLMVEHSDISINANGNLELSITGMSTYTAAQFDINLPEGVTVKNVSLPGCDSHSVAFSQADGIACVLAYSPLNHNFSTCTFEIEIEGKESGLPARGVDIAIDGIRLVKAAGNDITEVAATGCAGNFDISGLLSGLNRGMDIKATADGLMITATQECDITIADTLGRVWTHHLLPGASRIALPTGIYFIGNKKIQIK